MADMTALRKALRGVHNYLPTPFLPDYEPDLDDELTAVAIGPEGAKLVSNLPLALRNHA